MRARWLSLFVTGAVFLAAILALQMLGEPAEAEGFVFVCSAVAEPEDGDPGPGEFEQLRNGLAIAFTSGNNFFTFQGLAPPGVPVEGGGTVDPVTGGTRFQRILRPARIGEHQHVDFLSPFTTPGALGPELDFGLDFRFTAGAGFDDMGVRRLLNQNFGVEDDVLFDISLLGIDVDVVSNQAVVDLPQGFEGSFEAVFTFRMADGSNQVGGVRFSLDSLRDSAKIPNRASMALAFKQPEDPEQTYYAFGQKALFNSFDGVNNQPALGFGLDMVVVEPGAVDRDVLAVKADWNAAPRQVAVGLAQLCPDRAHIGWNMDPAGLPQPSGAELDLQFRSGERLGQTINVDDGAGGTTSVRANEVELDAKIAALPALMDFIALRDTMSLTRSNQAVPDVTLNRFSMADDDPEVDDDRPLHVSGKVTDLPPHLLLHADRNPDSLAIDRAELTSWNLRCPGRPVPPGPPAPDDVRRPDLTEDTMPLFPEGCERHNLAPIPTAEVNVQNWLPEDVDSAAATADLRAAPRDENQYGYYATRTTNPVGPAALYAFGARVNGVRRATVDLTGAQPGGSKARVYVERAPTTGADDSARFVVDVDGRTSTDETVNTGTRVSAAASMPDLPDTIRIDYESTRTSPVDVTWRADAPIAVTDGTVDAQLAAPEAFVAHGAFEVVATDGGARTPAARVQVTADASGGAVRYTVPPAPTDGFPSPVVPAFDPTLLTRLHAGAELTTIDDRAADVGTRLHADVDVPQPTEVEWNTDLDGRLASVVGRLCDPANPAACALTRFDATAARGPRTSTNVADLLTAPTLPVPTAPVSDAVPAFTDFRPGSGARAVILGPDSWGADALVSGVTQFFFHRDPLDVGVRLVSPTDQPFGVNLLDASDTVDLGAGPRPQVLFADAGLDRLPTDIRVRLTDLGNGPDQPWLWINTEDLGIENIADVDFTEDAPGTRPRLTGVLRLGDAEVLATTLALDQRPTPARDGSVSGVDVWGDYDLDRNLVAADATTSIEVPRHVAIWRPDVFRCDSAVDDVKSCQSRETYEIDQRDTLALQYRTTNSEIGDLNVKGLIHGDGLNWDVDARIDHVPGSLNGGLSLANNLRLPWVDVRLDLSANAPLGTIRANVRDGNNPVEYRQSTDPAGEGQCTEDDDRCTPNYAFDLANVAAELHIGARVQGANEQRLTPEPEVVEETTTDVGGIGFVHAVLDLGGVATNLQIEGREAASGQFVGTLRAFDASGAPAPVSGFLNARVDHITIGRDTTDDPADPFDDFVLDGGGLIGAIAGALDIGGAVTIGRIFQVFTLPLDLVIGLLAEIFFDGDLDTRFEVDMDLPLFVGFDRVDTIRFGMAGPTLSVDERHPGDGAPATIATRQQSLPSEEALTVDGAFMHQRNVEFSFDPILESFDISNSTTGTLQDIGIYRHRSCETHDEDDVCYDLADNAVTLDQVGAQDQREAGFTSGDALLDFFFTPGNRDEMSDENDGFVEPGVEFYKKFAEVSPPVGVEAFFVPDLAPTPVDPVGAAFGERVVCCNQTSFGTSIPGAGHTFGGVCTVSSVESVGAGPRAIGTDGTEYVVLRVSSTAVSTDADRTFCDATRLVLEAHHRPNPAGPAGALGPLRWSVALPTPAGMEPGGACLVENMRCELTTTVNPQADGSVQVETATTRFADGVNGFSIDTSVPFSVDPESEFGKLVALGSCCPSPAILTGTESAGGSVFGWVDASGHPGFHLPDATTVGGFSATPVSTDGAGNATLDPCAIAPGFGCGDLGDDTVQWLYGDGAKSDRIGGTPGPVDHRYPRTPGDDPLLGILVRYNADNEVVDKAYFTVNP